MGACITVSNPVPPSPCPSHPPSYGLTAWPKQVTAILLVQGALTILEEDLELDGNIYTPACLGQPFIDRLASCGFRIETKVINEK